MGARYTRIDHPILKKLPGSVQEEIAKMAKDFNVGSGEMVFRRGDPGDGFFMIRSGGVRIFETADDGTETQLAELGPGESFGEMALLAGASRAANAQALKDTCLTFFPRAQFDRILGEDPTLFLSLIIRMANWLMENDPMLDQQRPRQYTPPKLSFFDFFLIMSISILFAVLFNHLNPAGMALFPRIELNRQIGRITPAQAFEHQRSGDAVFIDARPTSYFEDRHIAGAQNIPPSLFEIMYMMALSDVDKHKKLIVYGRTVSRRYDVRVANKLFLRGHKDVNVLVGDLSAWEKNSYPVVP